MRLWVQRSAITIVAAVGVYNVITAVVFALSWPAVTDFVIWQGAAHTVAQGASVYDLHALFASERVVTEGFASPGFHDTQMYLYPPHFAWALAPLARLDLRSSLAVFLAADILAFALAYVFLRRASGSDPLRSSVLVISLTTVSGVFAFQLAQFEPIILFFLAAAYVSARHDRAVLCGVLAGIALLKPQTAWLMLPFLLAASWRAALGFTATALGLALSSFLIAGWRWPVTLIDNIQNLPQLGVLGSTAGIPNASAFGTSMAEPVAIALGLLSVLAAWLLRRRLRGQLAGAIALGAIASIMAAPHEQVYTFMLMAIPLVVWAQWQPRAALITAAAATLGQLAVEHNILGTLAFDDRWHVTTLWYAIVFVGIVRCLGGTRPLGTCSSVAPVPPDFGGGAPRYSDATRRPLRKAPARRGAHETPTAG